MSLNGNPSPPAEHVFADAFPPIPTPDDTMADDAPESSRPKGRKRFLNGLQRMSSSQSLLRLHRTSSSSGYRGSGKGSISCISLSSSSVSYNNPLGSSYGSQLSQGFSTAPTSIPSTPGDTPWSEDARVRYIRDGKSSTPRHQLSVGIPSDLKASRPKTSAGPQILEEDYFSCQPLSVKRQQSRPDFDFWKNLPSELKTCVLRLLEPRELVRCSRVSKAWHSTCFDGQLWATLDASLFYQQIPGHALMNIIKKAGSFARTLNLRGCAQLMSSAEGPLADYCVHLESLSLQDCRLGRPNIHNLLYQNSKLVHINLSGLSEVVTNTTLKIIAQQCPRLEHLDVSWCRDIDTRGMRHIAEKCSNLRDLRIGELKPPRHAASDFVDLTNELFEKNMLERLVIANSIQFTSEAFTALFEGIEPERDYLSGRAVVPPRKLRHLDVARCERIDDSAVLSMVGNVPGLEGLQLAKCSQVTDLSLTQLLPTCPKLTHLDLEELDQLTNNTLLELAKSPCKSSMQHLSISYCENLGDVGMISILRECKALRSLELDNTRVSDLVLIEAATAVRARPQLKSIVKPDCRTIPEVGLSMVVYDCQNVTWTGIREILSRNAEPLSPRGSTLPMSASSIPIPATESQSIRTMPSSQDSGEMAPSFRARLTSPPAAPIYPSQIIQLKVFYGYQPTVTEHTKRCLRGDFPAAARLERKWAEYMFASEEAGAPGGFGPGGFGLFTGVAGRRRRRRIREAAMMHADEEEESGLGNGRRRRARSGGSCAVM